MTKRILPREAAALLEAGWSYLDVRSIPEFGKGHPAQATNIPLLNFENGRMVPNPDFESSVARTFPKDAPLVVGCKSGGRSLQAATLMTAAGYTQVVDMRGGFDGERDAMGRMVVKGWAEEGLPVDASLPSDTGRPAK